MLDCRNVVKVRWCLLSACTVTVVVVVLVCSKMMMYRFYHMGMKLVYVMWLWGSCML